MAQLYVQRNAQPDTWVMSGAPTATTVFLSLDAAINYSDGTSDTLPANTLAVLPDTTTVFDRTHDVYVCYTVQASGVLSIIKESLLPTLTSDYAPLCRIEMHGIKPYQPEPYLAGGGLGATGTATTTTLLASSTAAKALSLGSSGSPPTTWYAPGFDDSAWGAAVVSGGLAAGLDPIPGSALLWSSNPGSGHSEKALFRQHFTLALPAGTHLQSAQLLICNDAASMPAYLNGTSVGPYGAGGIGDGWIGSVANYQTITLDPALLVSGDNVLAAEAQNDPIDADGEITYLLQVTTSTSGAEGDLLYFHSGVWVRLPIGPSGDVLRSDGTDPAWATPGGPSGVGTVTSVAVAGPTGTTASGSPVTSSGTLTLSWASQSAGTFLGAPSGGSGAPTFRVLASSDIPGLPASQVTSGQLAAARGGTGLDGSAAANGALLIGTGSGYSLATLTAGSGVTITNGSGTITIASSGGGSGTVTSVALTLPSIFSVAGSPVTTSGTLAATLANENTATVFAGPASGSAAAPTFRALQGSDLPAAAAAGGHIHAHGHFI